MVAKRATSMPGVAHSAPLHSASTIVHSAHPQHTVALSLSWAYLSCGFDA